MEWVGDGAELRLQILVVEEVLGAGYIEYFGGKLVQRMLKAFLGYLEGDGYQLVSVADGFLEELVTLRRRLQQPCRQVSHGQCS